MTAGQHNKIPATPHGAGTGTKRRKGGRVLVGAVALATLATLAIAQEGPNPSLTLTFGTALDVNDNRRLAATSAGTSTTLDNSLGLSYLSETAISSLRIDVGTLLRYRNEPGRASETGLDDPRFGLTYLRQGANSSLTFAASQRRSSVAFFDPFVLIDDPDTPVDAGDLTPGVVGTRTDTAVNLRLETGIEGPLGFSLGLGRRERTHSDTIDPSYFDRVTDTLSTAVRLQLSDRTTARVSYARNDYTAEDVARTKRLTQSLSLGLTHALTPDMVLGVTLGATDIVVDETIGGLRTRRGNDGLNAQLSLNRDLPNGGLGLTYSRDISINGTRDSLNLNRNLELPDGALAFALGASRLEGGSSTWIGSVAYRKDLPAGALTATLDRRAGATDANDEVTTTRARLGWSRDLTPVTGMNLSLDYLDTDSEVAGADRARARLQVAYNWELAPDWQLSVGYTRTKSWREAAPATGSNAVFLSLQRAFTFAP